MKKIRITGVPEHFNYPWLQIVAEQPLHEYGINVEWINESKGSGAMCKSLREGETDIAILLTESFISDAISGNTAKIIGLHVESPLVWGIHVAAAATAQHVNELSKSPFLISRPGSGSQLMAYVLAEREGWAKENLEFIQINNLEGAREAYNSGEKGIFLWEKFMTKPLVDSGEFKRLGEIPSPWPCFVMVANKALLEENPLEVLLLREAVYQKNMALKQSSHAISQLSKTYDLQQEDVKEWLNQTTWATEGKIEKAMLNKTMQALFDLGIIKHKIPATDLVSETHVELL
jgi:ABC-type nitrate/sulfonate/bicarbonate transport system substrate-binding protein